MTLVSHHPPTPCSLRKTAKCVTFHNPFVDPAQPCSSTPLPQGLSQQEEDHASLEVSVGHDTHIKGTEHKSLSTTPSKPLPQPAFVHCFLPKAIIPLKSALKAQLTKASAPCSTSTVQDMMALKQVFPNFFDTIGNMSGTLYHQD